MSGKKYFINISRFILLLIGMNVILTSILLLLHISISEVHLLLSIVLTITVFSCVSDYNWKENIIVVGTSVLCLIIVIILEGIVNEIAYDGNLYHKLAVGILKMGYNPIYEDVEEYLIQLRIPPEKWYNNQLWVGSYPKASWYFDASIYAVTNWIESAKAFNVLVWIASFGICCDYFSHKLTKKYAYVISLLLTMTPTCISMMFSFYLDGALGNLLTVSIVILMSITDDTYQDSKVKQFLYLGISIILCGNLKITGLAFEGAFCFSFYILWIIKWWKTEPSKNTLKKTGQAAIYYLAVVCITVLIVGAGTYVYNAKTYGNIIYPIGSNLEDFDINNNLKSVGLEDKLPIVQILSMIFVKTNTNDSLSYLEWKIPFTFDLSQIKHSVYDVIRGGTGIFYSGILCISLLMFIVFLYKFRNDKDEDKRMVFTILFVSLLLLCIIPAGGQTRYSPYIFYFVSFTIYLWMLKIHNGEFVGHQYKKVLSIVLLLTLFNTMPFTNYLLRAMIETVKYQKQYVLIKESGGADIDTKLPGLVFNFIDRNITYTYDTESELNDGEMKYLQLNYNYYK